jgi:hypothetical protein
MNGYNFFQTSFCDIFDKSNNPLLNVHIPLNESLAQLNLSINLVNWLKIDHKNILGEYAHYNNQIERDRVHPTLLAHTNWVDDILEPVLIKQKYL